MTNDKPLSSEFPFESNYVEIYGSRIHYIDVGSGDPILFLHGNPTSSYLWRNIIPHLSDQARCIAPDLIGMGLSGKPDIEYRFVDHARYLEGFIEKLGLANITLVIHDWGSALGFHYAMRNENNIKGIAFMEAILNTATWEDFPPEFTRMFKLFRTPAIGWFLISVLNLFVKQVLPKGIIRKLSDKEMEYYQAPYPRIKDRKPVWRWPNEIPIEGTPKDVARIVNEYNRKLRESDLPKLLFHARPGAILGPGVLEWCSNNLKNLQTVDLGKGIHYLQEDHPHAIGRELAEWYRSFTTENTGEY
ncbi:MAG: haloalkane dehalogenase [Balneolaceae bacterium]|nr:haloalkane dehalogenase [Balneolaceae bacterium]